MPRQLTTLSLLFLTSWLLQNLTASYSHLRVVENTHHVHNLEEKEDS